MMALGVLDAGCELGIRVPDELAVTGFDDIFIASLRSISLTTVRFDLEGLAELAIRSLLGKTGGKSRRDPLQYVTTPCRLIVRRTSGSELAGNGAHNLLPGNLDSALHDSPLVDSPVDSGR